MQLISGAAFRKRTLHPLAGATILQVLAELGTSPAARAAIETAEALLEVGATPLVAARGGSLVSELQARGGIFIPLRAQSGNPIDLALAFGQLVRLIRAEAVDILHARSCLSALVALGAARLTAIPFVTSFPSCPMTNGALASHLHSIMARGDRVVTEWACTARIAETLHPAAKGKIHVTGPGIDRFAFAAEAIAPGRVRTLRQHWGSPPDEPVVLFIGVPEAADMRTTFAATARLLRRNGLRGPRLVHIEAGPGSRCCTIDPAGETARFVPPCDDLPAAFLAAAIVVIPLGTADTICRLAVEAQAMGTPVVVPDEGPLSETVLAPPDSTEARRTGWRIPSDEPEALAVAIDAGLGLGASAKERLSMRARAHVDRNLSTERMRVETLRAFAAVHGSEAEA